MQLQPTCIVGTKTPQFCGNRSELQDYNPRASWVLKRHNTAIYIPPGLLQPTCIVGTKTIF